MNRLAPNPKPEFRVNRYRNTRPRGYTLIELLMTMSIAATLIGGASLILSTARTSYRSGKSDSMSRKEIRRFADDLRRDVHSSDSIDLAESSMTLMSGSESTTRKRT